MQRTVALDMLNYEEIIRVPYTTLPNFEKYHGACFQDPPSAAHLAAKKNMFDDDEIMGKSWFETPAAKKNNLTNKVAECLDLNRRCRGEFGRSVSCLKDIALLMQEDMAILHLGKLEACCFMFPSGWAPETKVGLSFAELHAPVANGERLRASADVITELMCGEHCYHRYVWGLASSGTLSAHPRYKERDVIPRSLGDIWFRYEHQITTPIDRGCTSLFTVDVQVIPYIELNEGHRERIAQAIKTMSPKVIEYKAMARFQKLLESEQ